MKIYWEVDFCWQEQENANFADLFVWFKFASSSQSSSFWLWSSSWLETNGRQVALSFKANICLWRRLVHFICEPISLSLIKWPRQGLWEPALSSPVVGGRCGIFRPGTKWFNNWLAALYMGSSSFDVATKKYRLQDQPKPFILVHFSA